MSDDDDDDEEDDDIEVYQLVNEKKELEQVLEIPVSIKYYIFFFYIHFILPKLKIHYNYNYNFSKYCLSLHFPNFSMLINNNTDL